MNNQNKIIIYSSANGETKIEVKLEDETVWLNQRQMAELFGKNRKTITEHIQNVFKEGELEEKSVCWEFQHTASDGKKYKTKYYNLDVIISVGYRFKSLQGTQFRIWATQKLKEYIVKGFVLDDNRLAGGKTNKTYFQELEERIRLIRTSEANFYQKVKDIFEWSKIKVDIQLLKDKSNLYFHIKEVWWASLGSNIGHEEDGKNKRFERPILIIKIFNKQLILIIPLSSKLKENNVFYSKFCLNNQYSSAILSQIRIISSKRLTRKIGRISSNDFSEIRKKIRMII